MTVKTEERHAQLELCIPYVFGRLNPGNRKQFEAHLSTGCEQCNRELSGLYEATALLPLLLRQETPPSGLRQRVLSRISSKRPEPQRSERPAPQREKFETPTPRTHPERPWYLYASIVLGVLLIIALTIFVNQLVATTGTQDKKIADLQSNLQANQEFLNILQAERLEMVALSGATAGSTISGRVLWDPAKRNALLQIAGLPAESDGNQYQLWILKDKKRYSAGLFDVTAGQRSVKRLVQLPVGERQEFEGFEVTMEPKGGSNQPTGTVQVRGAAR
jgi:anti-sigma-K factor RskA